MKKRLRLLAWMLTLTMLCELLPFGAFAQSDVGQQLALAAAQSLEEENGEATIIGKCGDNLQWSLSSDGVLTIDGTGKMFDYNSVPPYNISPWYHNTNITTLIVKEGVTSIGDYAFLGCYKISNISFPNSLTSIGYSAFDPCSGLTEITLPENLIYLGGYSLTSGNFSSISIPIGITSIEKYTFANCKKLKSVSLPDTLTSIGEGTFNQCTSLDSFNIPKNVVDIGRYAFWNCTSLKHIEIPSGIPQINEGTFDNCSSLKSISIPSSVVSIGESAFYGCNSLEDVYFSGTQSQWENISVANYQNTALENATIHYQSTGPEDEKEFTFGRDNLSFLNHSDYFFKRSNPIMSSFFDFIVKPNYINATLALSDEKFDLLTKNYVPRVKTVLDLCRSSSWGGSCLGMTDVAAIHYISPYKLPFSAATTYDLAAPVNDKSVQDLINYYQILQYSPTLRKVAIDRVVFVATILMKRFPK
ncbi:MAG: leucine-rich repeat domain-containing protein [Faecalibacterium prausnitzii]